MDNFDKNIAMVVFLGFVVLLYFLSISYLISHDENILELHRNDAKLQYFMESDNLTNQGKYNLVQSICNKTFSNESIYYNEMWSPRLPFWDIEGHIEHEINRCERGILGID